jgi:hypothetical protein
VGSAEARPVETAAVATHEPVDQLEVLPTEVHRRWRDPEAAPSLAGLLAPGRDLGPVRDVRSRHPVSAAVGAAQVCSELDSSVTLGRSSRAINGATATPKINRNPARLQMDPPMPATARTGPVITRISAAPNQQRPSRPNSGETRLSGECLTA